MSTGGVQHGLFFFWGGGWFFLEETGFMSLPELFQPFRTENFYDKYVKSLSLSLSLSSVRSFVRSKQYHGALVRRLDLFLRSSLSLSLSLLIPHEMESKKFKIRVGFDYIFSQSYRRTLLRYQSVRSTSGGVSQLSLSLFFSISLSLCVSFVHTHTHTYTHTQTHTDLTNVQ